MTDTLLPFTHPGARHLPAPTTARFQPLRLGLVGMWEYPADSRITLEGGWLHLRGANQSGKSKAIELTLPACLDGELTSRRLDPARSESRPMHDNLVGPHMPADRTTATGYAFVEFGRLDEDGTPRFFTAGYGVRASRGQRGHSAWRFTLSDRRVDDELDLSPDDIPRSETSLRDALSQLGGSVHGLEAHRKIVARELFATTADRLSDLLTLLLEIRAPKLGKGLDLAELTAMLDRTLPELDRQLFASVSEALQKLEDDRRRLDNMEVAAGKLTGLTDQYRTYVATEIETLVAATLPLLEERDRHARTAAQLSDRPDRARWRQLALAARAGDQDAAATLTAARDALPALQVRHDATVRSLERLAARHTGTRAELDTLLTSDGFVAASELSELEGRLEGLVTSRGELVADEREQSDHLGQVRADATDAHAQAERSSRDLDPSTVLALAAALGVSDRLQAPLDALAATPLEPAAAEVLRDAQRAADRHLTHVAGQLSRLAERRDTRAKQAAEAVGALQKAQDEREEAVSERDASADERDRQADAWREEVRAWARTADQLPAGERDQIADDADPDDREVTRAAVRTLADQVEQQLDVALSDAQAAVATLETTVEQRTKELAAARAASDPTPELASWRRSAPGRVALLRAVDLREDHGLSDAQLCALEGAMVASGLLTADLDAHGQLHADDGHVLVTGTDRVDGARLDRILRPLEGTGVEVDAIGAVLAAIAVDDTATGDGRRAVLGLDGTFVNGALRGRHVRETVSFLGVEARRRARLARIEQLTDEIAALERDRDGHAARAEQIRERRAQLRRQRDALPDGHELADAERRLADAGKLLQRREQQVRAASGHVEETEVAARRAAQAMMDAARDAQLEGYAAALPRLHDDVRELRSAAAQLATEAKLTAQLWRQAATARDAIDAAAGVLARTSRQRAAADTDIAKVEGRCDAARALLADAGTDADQLLDHQRGLEVRLEHFQTVRTRLDRAVVDLGHRLEMRRTELERAEEGHKAADANARELLRALGDHHRAGSLTIACDAEVDAPPLDPDQARPVVTGLLRQLAPTALRRDVDPSQQRRRDEARNKARTAARNEMLRAQNEINDALHGTYRVDVTADETTGLTRLVVASAEQQRDLVDFAQLLRTELETGRTRLDHSDRQVLQRFLTGDIRRELIGRIRAAARSVKTLSATLETITTNSGKRVGLRWEPREEHRDIVASLRRSQESRNPDDGDRLEAFLDAQLTEARQLSADPEDLRPLSDVLLERLDYRTWFRFVVEVSDPAVDDGAFTRLTSRTHGAESGGGKSMLLHLPLLAALAGWYDAAGAHAPRLVVLDEALEGIDVGQQAELVALMVTLDLDVVTTGYEKWFCFREVPALAIYDLRRDQELHVVDLERHVWDGRTRTVDGP